MVNPKVLIACPVYDGMKYCFDELLNSFRAFDYTNYDILLMDNSRNKEFYKNLKKIKYVTKVYLPMKDKENLRRLVRARNKIIGYFLKRNYDYLLMMDADVIAPPETIKKLLKENKDIISGLYFNYFIEDSQKIIKAIAWRSITQEEFEELKRTNQVPYGCKVKEDVRRNLTPDEFLSNKVYDVVIPSAGCMLIKRNVLEKGVKYGTLHISEITNKKGTTSDEIYFMREASKRGFKAYCHTGVKCKHLIQGKFLRHEGRLTHPLDN